MPFTLKSPTIRFLNTLGLCEDKVLTLRQYRSRPKSLSVAEAPKASNKIVEVFKIGEFKHEVRQFQKPYDNQQAEQISLMV